MGGVDNLWADDSDWDDGNLARTARKGPAEHRLRLRLEHTKVKYVDPLNGIVYSRSMFAVQWFYATLPVHHPDKLPPTQVLYFDEEPINSRLQLSVQEGTRLSAVLAIQDTTEFDLSHPHATEGLGYGTGRRRMLKQSGLRCGNLAR